MSVMSQVLTGSPVLNQDTLREGLRESIKRGIVGFVSALVPKFLGGDIVELQF